MVIRNGNVFCEDGKFRKYDIRVENGEIAEIGNGIASVSEDGIDATDCYVLPGMIDMHFHGCMGDDFCDGTLEALDRMARYEASIGVTSICPATMTLSLEELNRILQTAAVYKVAQNQGIKDKIAVLSFGELSDWKKGESDRSVVSSMGSIFAQEPDDRGEEMSLSLSQLAEQKMDGCAENGVSTIALKPNKNIRESICENGRASLVGINMEGPFISKVKRGAQDAQYILPCNTRIADDFLSVSGGLVKVIGIAPEEGDSEPFIREMSKKAVVSIAHSNADYDTAKAAFAAGASHAVHLYNAMPEFTHRQPGIVGAAAENQGVTAELICDGIHIHPSVVRATFQMFGAERMILISDSMRATGLADGRYTLGGQDVDVRGNRAVLAGMDALAGSVTSLPDCVRTAVKEMGIPLESAILASTANPAKKLSIYDYCGSISVGKQADLVIWDKDYALKQVILRGWYDC